RCAPQPPVPVKRLLNQHAFSFSIHHAGKRFAAIQLSPFLVVSIHCQLGGTDSWEPARTGQWRSGPVRHCGWRWKGVPGGRKRLRRGWRIPVERIRSELRGKIFAVALPSNPLAISRQLLGVVPRFVELAVFVGLPVLFPRPPPD